MRHLIIDERLGNLPDHVFAVGQNAIADVTRDEAGVTSTPFAAFDQPIAAVYNMRSATSLEPALALVVFLEDGAIHGLSSRGEEMERLAWPLRLGSRPSATDVSGEGAIEAFQENVSALLVATDDGHLRQVTINDDQPLTSWQLNDLGAVQAVA